MTPAFAEVQAWMQQAILDGREDGARAHVRGDNRLTAEARIGIYAGGYRQRLIECLENEYPVLAALVGPTVFALFARGYIASHPSRSYTLYDFGAGFADWLEAARPMADARSQAAAGIPAALARIERAKAEIHRAEGVERALAARADLDPLIGAMLGLTRYRRPDSVRLLALPFDFTATLEAFGQGVTPPPLPRPEPSLLGVSRMHYRIECHRLEGWQYDWIAGLPEAGGASPPVADPRLLGWLATAVTLGLAAPA